LTPEMFEEISMLPMGQYGCWLLWFKWYS